MSLIPLLKELEAARSNVARLENRLVEELASQPARFGFNDPDELAEAIRHAIRVTEMKARQARGVRKASEADAASRKPIVAGASDVPKPVPAAATDAPDTPAPMPAPLPAGTSLDDPRNFGLLPDFTLLDRPGEEASPERERLTSALQFAKRVIQTSRVPAAVWREWRRFEQSAASLLRTAGVTRVD